jgi:uncharacterized protein YggE
VLLLATACGGGDGGGEEAHIRTQKGLAVAAISSGLQAGATAESGDAADRGGAAPAPATEGGVAYDRAGTIAPDVYPYPFQAAQGSLSGITVQGYGSASVAADGAVLEFYFYGTSGGGVEPAPSERSDSSSGSSGGADSGAPDIAASGSAAPITEADLQPVVDALVSAGVPRANIEVVVQPSYGDIYSGGSATVRATVEGTGSLNDIVDAATSAAIPANISFSGTGVSYTVGDCPALERAALDAAVSDARERGGGFAASLGVGLGDVTGASSYSYSAYGSPCDGTTFGGPYPLSGVAYAETQAADVTLLATVTITFAME